MTRFLIALMLMIGIIGIGQSAAANDYRLGVEDKIALRAIVWNEAERNFEPWDIFGGEYSVQAGGQIFVPLAGAVVAQGLTASELSDEIAATLVDKGGLRDVPHVTVEITGYRPFYILGDVQHPGAYPGGPGLTTLQAVALAGGARQAIGEEGGTISIDSIRSTGNLRGVLAEMVRALARKVRLEAILADADLLSFPRDMRHPDGREALQRVLAEEQAIFASGNAAFERELASLKDLDALLEAEVAGLESKLSGLAEQLTIARDSVGNMSELKDRGFAPASRLADAQRNLFELESRDTDLQNSIFRARQRITENERDIIELSASRQTNATLELQKVQAELEKLQLTRTVMEQVLVAQGIGMLTSSATEVVTHFEVARRDENGVDVVQQLSASDSVLPGDVITVSSEIVPLDDPEYLQ